MSRERGKFVPWARPELEFSFAELFAQQYDRIRTTVLRHLREGVQLFAIDARGVQGELWLETGHALRAVSIGRHTHAELRLPDDRGLSLRHLTMLVRRTEERLTLRVIDLHTTSGLRDETGRRLASITADGPVFAAAGRFRFFLFPTAAGMRWPSSPADAWLALPPRVFLDAEPGGEHPAGIAAKTDPGIRDPETTIVPHAAPLDTDFRSWLAPGESPLGHLLIEHRRSVTRAAVGPGAAARGVLLGRYARCDVPGTDETMSRVHALVVREGGSLHVIDVGSTNGTSRNGEKVRCAPLTAETTFVLGNTHVDWEPAS